MSPAMQHSKGIIITFYTTLIAFITIAMLVLLLVMFIQKNYDIRLTIQETEQDRSVINLGQALLSSDTLNYVDIDGVVHRGVIDGDNIGNMNMDDIRKDLSYPGFYYTVTITDLDKNKELLKPLSDAEKSALAFHTINKQTREFPIAIRYNIEGVIDAGKMSISSGFVVPPKEETG